MRISSVFCGLSLFMGTVLQLHAQPTEPGIHVNQVAFDQYGPKQAVIATAQKQAPIAFQLVNAQGTTVFSGTSATGQQVADWEGGQWYYPLDFTSFTDTGTVYIQYSVADGAHQSQPFTVGPQVLANTTIPAILGYYHNQRANTPQELEADKQLLLFGSDTRVDLRGGWADASGDISKYLSHLAYANLMSPQQIPLVAWSMAGTLQHNVDLLGTLGIQQAMHDELLYGADYLMRALAPEGYFYMTVFSYFKKDPSARRVVGLLADSKTTNEYQSAFREGGGMAIAALARTAGFGKAGEYTPAQYLDAAKRAYAHLVVHNNEYTDDGKDNIIDDYTALLAATELWIATDSSYYGDEARERAQHLTNRLAPQGYFIADDGQRPFWHAADAGLPIIALVRYLDKEQSDSHRATALATIKKALDYNLQVTDAVSNPFGYARQSFLYQGNVQDGFFIPHENESGWWWQGENARLGSLATAALVGGRLVYPAQDTWGVKKELAHYAMRQLSWILGGNPYDMCFMYGFGHKNVPYMEALFGHGSQKGGISNGITGKDGHPDGSGIDFKLEDNGNEWRWTEQWIPHAAYFLQAVSAIAQTPAGE